jgi:hypothetical protein
MHNRLIIGIVLGAIAFIPATALHAEGFSSGRFARPNAAGGYSGGSGSAFRGPNRASAGGRAFVSDGQGNAAASSGHIVQTQRGTAGRASATTHNADGTSTHQSAAAASGVRGNIQSQGGFSYHPDSGVNTSRATNAQAKNSQASYSGNTTYSQGSGVDHQSTCTNAAGVVIECR